MEKISLPKASNLTSPNPLVLVSSLKPDGSTNLATVSWWTYLSYNPNMVAFAMAKTSYTGERVRETKEAIITVPATPIADAVMGCGTTSGRNTDKTSKFAITLADVEGSELKIPVQSRVAIHCSIKEYHEVGDHYLYICDVKEVYGDESKEPLFSWNGYAKIGPAHG